MPARERRAATVGLAVAAAHLLLLAGLLQLGVWRERERPPQATAPLMLRLLALEQPRAAAPATPAAPAAARRRQAATAAQAPALDVPSAAALPSPQTAAPATPVAEPAPPPRPLVLDLPRSASAPERRRNPALDDPRSNTAGATVESRIAAVMGDGRWTETLLPDGRRIYRNGAACIELQPARIEQLDGFNKSFSPKPMAAKPC